MTFNTEIKLGDIIKYLLILVTAAVLWGENKVEMKYLRVDTDANRDNIKELVKNQNETSQTVAKMVQTTSILLSQFESGEHQTWRRPYSSPKAAGEQ